jgi:hypothetical protein
MPTCAHCFFPMTMEIAWDRRNGKSLHVYRCVRAQCGYGYAAR